MYKKTIGLFVSTAIISLAITIAFSSSYVEASEGQVTRICGSDRYQTAANVAKANWITNDNAILVSGNSYADSISASVLASKLNAPILFTGKNILNTYTEDILNQLKPDNIYVIGGKGVISGKVEDQLKQKYKVTRLSGHTRYDTNLSVANQLVKLGMSKDKIIAVSGVGYADALSAVSVSTATDQILLLTSNNKLQMKNTIDFAKNSNVSVIGTTNSVNKTIYESLKAVKRITGGSDRFATNLSILKSFDNELKTDRLYVSSATGNEYTDVIVASAIAGRYSAPLVLVNTENSNETNNAIDYIRNKANKNTNIQAIGGKGVITDTIVAKINNVVNGDNTIVNFKDKNLETAIRLTIKKPTGTLYKSDVDKIAELNLYFNNIKDLSGIENLTSLQRLGLSDNQVSDISPLKNLTNLRSLFLSDNQINNISPLKNLTNLEELSLNYNHISDVSPLENLTNLKLLTLWKTPVKDITPLKKLINLQNIVFAKGQLSDNDVNSLKNSLPKLNVVFQ